MTVWTVSQLNIYLKGLFAEDTHLQQVHISGEISNFTNHYKSGHFYFSLKDESGLLKAVMFRGQASKVPFRPENGMKVIATGRVSVFERDGVYQLYVEDLQPDGLGALHLAYEQLKEKLQREGLFDQRLKRPLPAFPMKIGIATAPTGAVIRDMATIIGRRFPLAEIQLIPVMVQGPQAPEQLIRAIETFNRMGEVEVIIIGRGGGSLEDLYGFNHEALAYAIRASGIPIISAVGHETDFTIADFAADLRAPTPSAAAELVVPDRESIRQLLKTLWNRGIRAEMGRLDKSRQRLNAVLQKKCLTTPIYIIDRQYELLDYKVKAIGQAMGNRLNRQEHRLQALRERIRGGFQLQYLHQKNQLGRLAATLDALSPMKVLSRGYSLAVKDGKTITSSEELRVGDPFTLRLQKGSIEASVLSVEKPS